MAFPIFPEQNFPNPPDPRLSIVNYAEAFDKIIETAGRITNIQESLTNIDRMNKESDMIAAQTVLKQRETELVNKRIEFEYNNVAMEAEKLKNQNALAQAKINSAMLADAGRAKSTIANNYPELVALVNDSQDFTDQIDNTTDPAKRQAMIDDWQKTRLDPVEKKMGVKVGKLAAYLPPNDPWAEQLKNIDATNLRKMSVETTPVWVAVPKDIAKTFDKEEGASAELSGYEEKNRSYTQKITEMKQLPLSQAIALWKMGVDTPGLKTFLNSAPEGEERDRLKAFMEGRGITDKMIGGFVAEKNSAEATDLQSKIAFNEKIMPNLKGEKLAVIKADTDQMKQKLSKFTSQPAAGGSTSVPAAGTSATKPPLASLALATDAAAGNAEPVLGQVTNRPRMAQSRLEDFSPDVIKKAQAGDMEVSADDVLYESWDKISEAVGAGAYKAGQGIAAAVKYNPTNLSNIAVDYIKKFGLAKWNQFIETGRQKKIKQIREAQQLLAGQGK